MTPNQIMSTPRTVYNWYQKVNIKVRELCYIAFKYRKGIAGGTELVFELWRQA